mmetsp:Transcript_16017/g.24044  ORF Transcript_16017/g.24044 Transcript_16017/m.24044 type:complete len:427 (-) Transcript_16017:189-1469(-)
MSNRSIIKQENNDSLHEHTPENHKRRQSFKSSLALKHSDHSQTHAQEHPVVSPPSGHDVSSTTAATTASGNRPPPPPRTAFMIFSDSTNSQSKGTSQNSKDINLNVDAERWRVLSPNEKSFWEDQAREEKLRYIRAKTAFVPTPSCIPKRRAKKHPLAPKRPMSAFLKYSLSRRRAVKADNPDMNNTDISRLLGEMWRNAHEEEKRPYVEEELKERNKYKKEISKWRLIQKKKEMDDELNDHLENSLETAHLKPTVETPIAGKSIHGRPSSEDFCFSSDDRPNISYHQSSYASAPRNNDVTEDGNHYRYPSPAVGRREMCSYHPHREEQMNSLNNFQQGTPDNYRGQDFVNNNHHSYFPPRERAHYNHGLELNHSRPTSSPNFEGTFDERHRFEDNSVPVHYNQQNNEHLYYHHEGNHLAWEYDHP